MDGNLRKGKNTTSSKFRGHWKRKDKTFAKYGHTCSIEEQLDDLELMYPDRSCWTTFKRKFSGFLIASDWICKACSTNLKSHSSVMLERNRQLHKFRCSIHPFSEFKHYWDCFMIFINFIQLIITPLEVGLGAFPAKFGFIKSFGFILPRFTFDCICCIDICVGFMTGYYDVNQKEVELRRKYIAKHYICTGFLIDFLASIPTHWEVIFGYEETSDMALYTRGISLLKVLRLYILSNYAKRICNVYNVNYYTRQISFIFVLTLLVWHINSCVFYYILRLDPNIRVVEDEKLESATPFFLYVLMMYNGIVRFCLVAIILSDHASIAEIVLGIIEFILGKIFQVYILARVIEILKAKFSAKTRYNGVERQVVEFMRHKQLPMKVRQRVLSYYEYHYHHEFFQEHAILRTISSQLRQDILMEKCKFLTQKVEFFRVLPMSLLEKIVSFLKMETYMTNDVIVKANTTGNCMYFILSGTVAVYTNNAREVCHLDDGAYFGEVALIMPTALRVASVVAIETSELLILTRRDFIRTIHPYPDIVESVKRTAFERFEDTTVTDFKSKDNRGAHNDGSSSTME